MNAHSKKPRILVVEDEAIVARDILQQMAELGYEVVGHATRGEDAVELAERLRPDLVLMDIQLAGAMDGIAAAQAIKDRLTLPVVFLTAFSADEMLERAKLTEPFGYILKPFSERELYTVLEMALYKYQAEMQLREAALRNQIVLDNMLDGVITLDGHGLIGSFNQAACTMFGYRACDVMGLNVSLLMPEPHASLHDGYLQDAQANADSRVLGKRREVLARRKDGSEFPVNLSVTRACMAGQTVFIGLLRDLSQNREDENEIRRLAFYDALTGLPNRRLLTDRLEQAMLTSLRTGQHGAVMFLDLDHFKQLNDSLGHAVGDELLLQVAQRLQQCVREGDSVARLGGDEFVVLLEDLSLQANEAATQAELTAKKILDALSLPYTLLGHQFAGTPSIGIMMFMQDHESIENLLNKADVAMYQAKSAGRNTARFFDPAMQAVATAHRAGTGPPPRFGRAAVLFALPDSSRCSGCLHRRRSVVRWQHERRGLVSPAQFIPLAEETGLILPLGQWVLETACAQMVLWAENPATTAWTMAVNISSHQFAQPDFVASVACALRKTGANPHLLKLELTESMLVGDVEDVIGKMRALKAHGVGFSLDDFGTGYSSLSHLKRLPLDQLKIDQSFVRDIMSDANDAVIARTIVALGHSLGLKVIAEGVETAEQRSFLASVGCDAFQGYFFGRPQLPNALPKVPPPVTN
ncbi:putative bifunctional diguanylate cyclase/phosphodiesterase [Roseateles sp. GG27B]